MITRILKVFMFWTNIAPFNKWKRIEKNVAKDFWLLVLFLIAFAIVYLFGWLWLIVALVVSLLIGAVKMILFLNSLEEM